MFAAGLGGYVSCYGLQLKPSTDHQLMIGATLVQCSLGFFKLSTDVFAQGGQLFCCVCRSCGERLPPLQH